MPIRPTGHDQLEAGARAVVERLGGHWRPGGAMCHCPVHDDAHPSLSVRVGERCLLVKCFAGCAPADVLRAINLMGLGGGTSIAGAAPAAALDGRRGGDMARRLWERARPIEGTPADGYLRSRGLAPPHPQARYLARTPLGRGLDLRFIPALLVAVRSDTGVAAVQRVFLDPRTGAKRDMTAPRRTLGRPGDGAVRLAAPGVRLGLAEGYETARSAMQLLRLPVWAALGAERLHRIAVPPSVRHVVLLLDPDEAGERAAARAAAAYGAQGLRVEIRWPPARGDWNDALILGRKGEGEG